jgi:hypothetical protein
LAPVFDKAQGPQRDAALLQCLGDCAAHGQCIGSGHDLHRDPAACLSEAAASGQRHRRDGFQRFPDVTRERPPIIVTNRLALPA